MSRIHEALKRAEQERAPIQSANEAKPSDSLLAEGAHRDGGEWSALGMVSPVGPGIESPNSHHLRLDRSEEHTSELQSRLHLVCRLLLEKKKKKKINTNYSV